MFVLRSVEQEVNVILGPPGISKGVSNFAGINEPAAQASAIQSLFDQGCPGAGSNRIAAAKGLGHLAVIDLGVNLVFAIALHNVFLAFGF
jgi:hypothetical protein